MPFYSIVTLKQQNQEVEMNNVPNRGQMEDTSSKHLKMIDEGKNENKATNRATEQAI